MVFIWCWLFCATLLWAPFLYNFQGLDYTCVQTDFWEWWDFMKGGWFGRMAGWGEWHQQSIALYKGCCLSLILRNSLQLIVPLALAFKYDDLFCLLSLFVSRVSLIVDVSDTSNFSSWSTTRCQSTSL